MAARAGISTDAVAALERGRRTKPHRDTVVLLTAALQLATPERDAFVAVAAGTAVLPDAPSPSPAALPTPPTPLIGREGEVAAVAALLDAGGAHILTLTGPGGVGKTRLALAAAAAVRDHYADGVSFVDLSGLRDAALVASTVAQALGLREDGAQHPRDLVRAFLRAKQTLVVLDNFEQVIEAAPLLATLTAAAPRLTLLVTSRTVLHLQAEQQFDVPPLVTPAPGDTVPPDAAAYAALRLFEARARAVLPTFRLDATNTGVVAEICRQLDGLPLAIELAAARVRMWPPALLLPRLERRLGMLTGKARDLPERQQGLRATIEWSYALLPPWERDLFRSLSVFTGGCTLDALDAVVPQTAQRGDTLAGIETLIDHSLLRITRQPDGEPRFGMLETVREYGGEQLVACGEEAAARRAHGNYFLALAETATPHLFGAEQMPWLERLECEHDNLRAVLADARDSGDAARGTRLAGALWRFWYIRCHMREGHEWLREFVAHSPRPYPPDAADALVGLAVIAYARTDYEEAAAAATDAAALTRALDDRPNLVVSLNILGGVARHRSDFPEATVRGEECVALTRALDDRWALALSLHNLADVARLQGAYDRAEMLATESLTLARALGDRWGIVQASLVLGQIARDRGAGDAAAWFTESLTVGRELGHTRDTALALSGLAAVARLRGEYTRALALQRESLALLRPLEDRIRLAQVLTGLGRVHAAADDRAGATAAYRESLLACDAAGNTLGVAENLAGLAAVADASDAATATHATRLLAAAMAIRETIGAPLPPAERADHDALRAHLRERLGHAAFADAWAAGSALTVAQAVALLSMQ